MCVGVGGSPEGIVTACAMTALGGYMQGRLRPRTRRGAQQGTDAGLDLDQIYESGDLVTRREHHVRRHRRDRRSLVDGVRRVGGIIRTESIVLRGRSGTLRRIVSEHLRSKWL